MRQIQKNYKKGFFRKLFIKLCRLLGYELIDQADMSFATSSTQENVSVLGNKSITLPLGEVKITRKIKSLDIIIKTCTSVNLVTQSKSRIFEAKKSEYTFRTINSLIKSLSNAQRKMSSINYNITVLDSGSLADDLKKIEEILNKSSFSFKIIKLNINDYGGRIKTLKKNNKQIEDNMRSTMASIIKSFEMSKNLDDLIYFVEDDYIHRVDSILEMLSVYEKFATIFKDEIFLVPVDYPYLYQKNLSSNILVGHRYHWRSVNESLLTFITSKYMINKYYKDLIKMGEIEHSPYETILHNIYNNEKCFSPIPSLALHCTNVNSVFGLSPNIDFKKLWEENNI
tara:strand:+ start:36 stop:1058 length:1023 start_codon:yes stop_codon:yes gene_type:complete